MRAIRCRSQRQGIVLVAQEVIVFEAMRRTRVRIEVGVGAGRFDARGDVQDPWARIHTDASNVPASTAATPDEHPPVWGGHSRLPPARTAQTASVHPP